MDSPEPVKDVAVFSPKDEALMNNLFCQSAVLSVYNLGGWNAFHFMMGQPPSE